jgi:two-component system sensor histidine kinase UhpB
MKTLFVFLCLSFFCSFSQAQVPKSEDSLRTFLQIKPKDTLYIWAMRPYALKLIYGKANYKAGDSIANEIKTLSEKLNYGRGIYFHYLIKAIIATNQSKYAESLVDFKKCLESVEKYKLNYVLRVASLNNISLANSNLGNNDEAMKYALKAIEIQEKYIFTPKFLDIGSYQTVADILKDAGKLKEALKYVEKSLEVAKKKEDLNGIAIGENKLGNIYDDMELQQEALKHYKIGYEYALKADYPLLQTDLLSNLGRMELHFGNYQAAEKYLLQNEKLCIEVENEQALQTNCLDLGNLYEKLKKYNLAEKCFLKAKSLFKANTDPKIDQIIATNLFEFYEITNDIHKAFKYLKEANIARDSAFKIESQKLTQDLLAKYETEKKEAQIKLLNEEAKTANWQRNALLGGSILAVLLAIILVAFLNNRNKLKRLEENQKLRNRISADLHDEIGSTLSSISILSEIVAFQQKKGEFKPEIMQQVSNDAREVIEKMDDIIWTINPENDAFNNLETRLKSFAIPLFESKDIDFKFDFSPELENLKIDMSKRRDIYLILKEAINNLIKYSQCQKAELKANLNDNKLTMSILDDGIGFDIEEQSLRNGQKNMKRRAEKIGANLEIKSNIGKGTEVKLSIEAENHIFIRLIYIKNIIHFATINQYE